MHHEGYRSEIVKLKSLQDGELWKVAGEWDAVDYILAVNILETCSSFLNALITIGKCYEFRLDATKTPFVLYYLLNRFCLATDRSASRRPYKRDCETEESARWRTLESSRRVGC